MSEKYGLLSGLLAKGSGKGSKDCPWSFIVGPSQTLLLSLWDFGVWTYEADGDSNRCMIYAHVKSSGFVTTVCPGRESKRLFYTKSDGTVNVSLQHGDSLNYLIEFEGNVLCYKSVIQNCISILGNYIEDLHCST